MSYITVTGKVIATKRASASRNGNPSFDVTIRDDFGTEATYRTASDVMLAYGIENTEYKTDRWRFDITKSGKLDGYATRQDGIAHTLAPR